MKSKFLPNNPKTQLHIAEDGAIYIQTGDDPEVLLAEEPLHTISGDYFIGKEYEEGW